MQLCAGTCGVALHLKDFPDQTDTCYDIDDGPISQVLLNLLSNAVKFSPKRSTVCVTPRPAGGRAAASVAVSNGLNGVSLLEWIRRSARLAKTCCGADASNNAAEYFH